MLLKTSPEVELMETPHGDMKFVGTILKTSPEVELMETSWALLTSSHSSTLKTSPEVELMETRG